MAISITEDIRDLLYENQLVIIHGLGMITATYKGAQIDESAQTISPPSLLPSSTPALSGLSE
jgi:hypothetical protein